MSDESHMESLILRSALKGQLALFNPNFPPFERFLIR
jgi:hypothetical protein